MEWLEHIEFWQWWVLAALLMAIEVFAPTTLFLWTGIAAAAVGFMNQRRADLGLTLLTVTTDAQAYTDLKLERALELWLEGRRLFDIRRWEENNISGGISDVRDGIYGTGTAGSGAAIGNETAVGVLDTQLTTLATNARCWPIGRSEVETNENVTR